LLGRYQRGTAASIIATFPLNGTSPVLEWYYRDSPSKVTSSGSVVWVLVGYRQGYCKVDPKRRYRKRYLDRFCRFQKGSSSTVSKVSADVYLVLVAVAVKPQPAQVLPVKQENHVSHCLFKTSPTMLTCGTHTKP
jgi:hypothetical protein